MTQFFYIQVQKIKYHPHVAKNNTRLDRSAIDGRTIYYLRYMVSISKLNLIDLIFS